MAQELGAWLRQEREIRGWDRIEMAKRLIAAGRARGDKHMPGVNGMSHNIYRWERGGYGVSPRHMLNYCAAFGIPPAEFPRDTSPRLTMVSPRVPADSDPSFLLGQAVGGVASDPGIGVITAAAGEVLAAAHEGSERAEQAEQRGIGDATVEQFRADVMRLSREYMTCEPLPVFREMRRVRGRMHAALDRRIWPQDSAEIYFLLGCVNGLMADVAHDLGCPGAAQELYRAGWAYATAIGQRALLAKLRLGMAGHSYWNGQFKRAADLAASGLEQLPDGPTGAQLHLMYGRAAARIGDTAGAQRAVILAEHAGARDYSDDLTEIGGEYDLSQATTHYLIASVFTEIVGASADATAQLERAVELYAAGPGADETHGYAMEAIAQVSLAEARLRDAELDGAIDALAPVLGLVPGKRIDFIRQRLDGLALQLARHPDHGSAALRELAERIAEYGPGNANLLSVG